MCQARETAHCCYNWHFKFGYTLAVYGASARFIFSLSLSLSFSEISVPIFIFSSFIFVWSTVVWIEFFIIILFRFVVAVAWWVRVRIRFVRSVSFVVCTDNNVCVWRWLCCHWNCSIAIVMVDFAIRIKSIFDRSSRISIEFCASNEKRKEKRIRLRFFDYFWFVIRFSLQRAIDDFQFGRIVNEGKLWKNKSYPSMEKY